MPFKLSVKNFGSIKVANLELTRINVLVGPQSSGKSTILKIASFCNWLEKQIQLSQNPLEWATPQTVKDNLLTFHRLEGFADVNSEILFKSETMAINIRFKEKSQIGVDFEWSKSKHWNYTRTKNTYIPAERNIVAAIPNWMDINFDRFNNVRNYMAEWGISRKLFDKKNKLDILNMGVSYFYDQSDETDKISLNGKTLKFSNASSGLQSLIPQYALLSNLFDYSLTNAPASLRKIQIDNAIKHFIESNPKLKEMGILDNYLKNCGVKVFLEEPEQNLFPEAQYRLVKWFASKLNGNHHNNLFLSTHSPYILASLNNLIQAHDSAKKGATETKAVEKILKQGDFINFDEVRVYGIDKGRAKNLLDKENRLISQSFLDSVSMDISNEFGQLLSV